MDRSPNHEKSELKLYKRRVKQVLTNLTDVFARASIGDFSKNVKIDPKEDEFTELQIGVQIMLDVIREAINKLTVTNQDLLDKSHALADAQKIAKVGSWEMDLKTKRVVWSDELFAILGISIKGHRKRLHDLIDIAHPEDKKLIKKATEKTLHKGQPYEIEYRINLHNKVTRYIFARGSLIRDRTGTPLKMIGTAQDITERKNNELELQERTEQVQRVNEILQRTKDTLLSTLEDLRTDRLALQREKAKDEAILRSIGEGMLLTDAKSRIVMINPIAKKLLGLKGLRIVGKRWPEDILEFETTNGKPIPIDKNITYKACCYGKTYTGQYEFTTKKGVNLPVTATASPVFFQQQKINVITIFRDISKEREIDRAKSEFVSLASHQLRTPLAAVNWYTEVLLNNRLGELNKKQHDYVEEIYKGNKRLIKLVAALLNVSRIELGKLAVSPRKVKLPELLDSVISSLAFEMSRKNITLKKKYDPRIPTISLDPSLISIVVQNIIDNAIKYSPRSSVVTVKLLNHDKDVLLIVKDAGYGIPKYAHSRIFTKLFRADNIKKKVPNGTGLGLYTVKHIVEQLAHGRIWFRSTTNKGTTFYVSIPKSGMKAKKGSKGLHSNF